MHIVHLISSPAAGGAEVLVRDLSAEQVRLGNDVTVIFYESAVNLGRSEVFSNNYLQYLEESEVSWLILRGKGKVSAVKLFDILKVISRFKNSVFHVHAPIFLIYFLLWGSKECVIYTHHNIHFTFSRILAKILFRRVWLLVGISTECARALRERRFNKRVIKIYNGVPAANSPGAKDNVSISDTGKKKIVMVGTLIEQKNYTLAFEVFSRLAYENIDFHVDIFGEGPLMSTLEMLRYQLGLSEFICFRGNVLDIRDRLGAYDLLVSTSEYEGFPISMLEARALSLPIVGTAVGGVPEIIRRSTGTCCEGEVHSIVNSVIRAFRGDFDYNTVLDDNVDDIFSIRKCAKEYLRAYESVS